MLAAVAMVHGAAWLVTVNHLAVLFTKPSGISQEVEWPRVAIGPVRRAGWPASAALEFGPTSIVAGELGWRAERVIASTALCWPWIRPGPIELRPTGQRVRYGSDVGRAVSSQNFTIEVVGDSAGLQTTDFGAAGLFEVQALQIQVGPWGLEANGRHLRLFGTAGAPGPVIDTFGLRAALTPPVPLLRNPRSAAIAWHAAGGVIEVADFTLTMNSTQVRGTVRVWLDAALQPRLDGVLHITGYAAGLDELVTAGFLRAQTAIAAKAVLGLLAAPSTDGGADVPVTIDAGILTVAQFPVRRLPILEWFALGSEP